MQFSNTITALLSFSLAINCVYCEGTTLKPETTTTQLEACKALEIDCETCLKNPHCLWCNADMPNANSKCVPYPVGDLIPKKNTCPLSDAKWGVCWVNYKALLISMGVIAGVIVLSIASCCIYCCCCRGNAKRQQHFAQEDARLERDSAERESRNSERRQERQSKYDEIRRKYGLTKEDGYKRFENE